MIGVSLGGAAFLLAPGQKHVNAAVLESVYPDIHNALTNRLRARLGGLAGAVLAPLIALPFEWLMPPLLHVRVSDLRPIDHIGAVASPLLIISGTSDAYTPIEEAQALFARAAEPKQFWAVASAAHVDLQSYDPSNYWTHVLPFLQTNLQKNGNDTGPPSR